MGHCGQMRRCHWQHCQQHWSRLQLMPYYSVSSVRWHREHGVNLRLVWFAEWKILAPFRHLHLLQALLLYEATMHNRHFLTSLLSPQPLDLLRQRQQLVRLSRCTLRIHSWCCNPCSDKDYLYEVGWKLSACWQSCFDFVCEHFVHRKICYHAYSLHSWAIYRNDRCSGHWSLIPTFPFR